MRYSAKLLTLAALTVGYAGCGPAGGLQEGIPKDAENTYTPAIAVPTMNPKDQAKSKQNAKSAAAAAPVETPK